MSDLDAWSYVSQWIIYVPQPFLYFRWKKVPTCCLPVIGPQFSLPVAWFFTHARSRHSCCSVLLTGFAKAKLVQFWQFSHLFHILLLLLSLLRATFVFKEGHFAGKDAAIKDQAAEIRSAHPEFLVISFSRTFDVWEREWLTTNNYETRPL